ncbi:hypothetical protein DDE82_000183 [Stemphylium lycopersici]|nr:hypothetical protein DDE82_000183 [Stemphylium lycopersici]
MRKISETAQQGIRQEFGSHPQITDPKSPEAAPSRLPDDPEVPHLLPPPARKSIVQAIPELVGEVARSPKKRGAKDEPCQGSQCIMDSVDKIVEKNFGYKVDASSRANACYEGDYFDDEDDTAESEEEVEDDDEDNYYVSDEEQMKIRAAERNPTENTAKKAYNDEAELVNRR